MKNKQQQKILVTGGAGFIGSALVRLLSAKEGVCVVNVDALNYAGDLSTVEQAAKCMGERYQFYHLDICDAQAMRALMHNEKPCAIIHLAAQTHVDRSIDEPLQTVQTNVMGTLSILEAARSYWQTLDAIGQQSFRFVHVSTDEVYGDVGGNEPAVAEGGTYKPNSPYSASKAGADHLVRAWHQTYGLPVLLTHCCNNYGAYQYPEKLIPHMILNALAGRTLPIYGDGLQQREWIFVEDHVRALWQVLQQGKLGQTYHIGTEQGVTNLELVRQVCHLLEKFVSASSVGLTSYESLITHVEDRPGHDKRYALAAGKIRHELGWQAQTSLADGLSQTVEWYVKHQDWWQAILEKGYALKRQGFRNAENPPD